MGLFGPPNVEKMRAKGNVMGLIKALGYQKDWQTGLAAASALGELKDGRAVEPLVAVLKDGYYLQRETAARALGEIGDARAVAPLVAVLGDDYSTVRGAASQALVRIGAHAVEPLVAALKDSDSDVRVAAAQGLAGIGLPPDLRTQAWHAVILGDWERAIALGSVAVEPFFAALRDSDEDVRKAAAQGLAGIGLSPDPRALALHAVILGEWERAIALGSVAVEPLVAALKDGHYPQRAAAARALGEIGDARAVEPLVAALKDSSWHVRKAAAQALGEIGDARAVKPLVPLLKDSSSYVQEAAAQALVRIGPDAAVKLLVAALKDFRSSVRREAASGMR